MKKFFFLFFTIFTFLVVAGCENQTATTQPKPDTNTTPAPSPTVYTLGITPEVFQNRWNKTADITQFSSVKLQEVPSANDTDKTIYTFSKNNTLTIYIQKDQKKVKHLVLQSNIFKTDQQESEMLGALYYLVLSTVEPNLTEQDMDQVFDELMNAWQEGTNKTVTKGNSTFQQTIGLTGNLELIVKHKNDNSSIK